jgi:hypothetical protein
MVISCTSDGEESGRAPSPSTPPADGLGGAGGREPDRDVVELLQSLPVFPNSRPESLADGKYAYLRGASEIGRDLRTGFQVLPGTPVDEVTAFFAKGLPQDGWVEETPPRSETGEKQGSGAKWVIYSFLKGEVRLLITIPLTHKDAPDGVVSVGLTLAPKEIPFDGPPVTAGIDATPPPTPAFGTPTGITPVPVPPSTTPR